MLKYLWTREESTLSPKNENLHNFPQARGIGKQFVPKHFAKHDTLKKSNQQKI